MTSIRYVGFSCTLMLVALLAVGCAPVKDAYYWRQYEMTLRDTGRLRTERNPADAKFTNTDLIENFRQIMFYNEFVREYGKSVKRNSPRKLEKFSTKVGYSVIGSGVTSDDLSNLRKVSDFISKATGLNVYQDEPKNSRVHIMILNNNERLIASNLMKKKGLRYISEDFGDWSGGVNVCAAYPLSRSKAIFMYIILIPDETSGLLRRACIEEEFAQAFGPAADSDRARPSVFNDDAEFALLTVHDELLFRILYDPRLKAGMTEKEAMPIVRKIVGELRPEPASAPAAGVRSPGAPSGTAPCATGQACDSPRHKSPAHHS